MFIIIIFYEFFHYNISWNFFSVLNANYHVNLNQVMESSRMEIRNEGFKPRDIRIG
jgi:hypothetical protein